MGGYVESILNSQERVIAKAYISWWSQVIPIILSIVAAIILLVIFAVVAFVINENFILVGYGLAAFELFFVFARAYLVIKTTEIALTNQRIIVKKGFIQRDTKEVPLDRVESIELNQTVLGRIFNIGSISINGTGGMNSPMKCIGKPMDFKKAVDQNKHYNPLR